MPDLRVLIGKIERSDLSAELKTMMSLVVDFFQQCTVEKEQELSDLQLECVNLRKRVETLENKQDESNQYSRQDTLTISPKKDRDGQFLSETVPTFQRSENTKDIVRQMFKDHLKLELNDTDISIAHRLQPPRSSSSEPVHDRRNIIVRFCRKDLISTIFKHCKEVSLPFYINESLTPVRNSICYALRELKRKHDSKNIISKVRTFKGMPRVFITPSNSRPSTRQKKSSNEASLKMIEVPTILSLEEFVKTHLDTTLQDKGITIRQRV